LAIWFHETLALHIKGHSCGKFPGYFLIKVLIKMETRTYQAIPHSE